MNISMKFYELHEGFMNIKMNFMNNNELFVNTLTI